MMPQDPIQICMIADENYVMPTCVTIQSIASSATVSDYVVNIVASALSEEADRQFQRLETPRVKIHILRDDAEKRFHGLHTFDANAICVASIAALLKFSIPELFPELDKILYLDGDLIVKDDLSSLYATVLDGNYAATVTDSSVMYYHHTFTQKVQRYFNSGVMLLNLVKMREDNLTETLIRTKKELQDSSLMDQNVFNIVFDGKTVEFPVVYNYLTTNLARANEKWTINDLNALFHCSFKSKVELDQQAKIIHFSSRSKPWKDFNDGQAYRCAHFGDWYEQYKKACIPHTLSVPTYESASHPGLVSVIMPCYNTEAYVGAALDSLLNQTYQQLEIICIDDGSTDGTANVLQRYAEKYPQIVVKLSDNHGSGYQRNAGLQLAHGEYIHFMDSDDLLAPIAYEHLVREMELNLLDAVYFEGGTFFEAEELAKAHSNYTSAYHRKNFYPNIYRGKEFFIETRQTDRIIVQPCMQFYRRCLLVEHHILFSTWEALEDNAFYFDALFAAERVKCLPDAFFHRRVRRNSIMTASDHESYCKRLNAHMKLLHYLGDLGCRYVDDPQMSSSLSLHLFYQVHFFLQKMHEFDTYTEATQRASDLSLAERSALFLATYTNTVESNCSRNQYAKIHALLSEKKAYERELEVLRQEKKMRWKELQELRKEKAERWEELQALRKEKKERWELLQSLRKELNACKRENETLQATVAHLRRPFIRRILSGVKRRVKRLLHIA